MAKWKSTSLLGSTLEEYVNRTNQKYLDQNLALVQKIPTPITPVTIDDESQQITLAYFAQKSTVDYIGVVQGIPVCFDAKECRKDTFPLDHILKHQLDYMESFERQGGIAFLLIAFMSRDEYYYLSYPHLSRFLERRAKGGRKSFCYGELDPQFFLGYKGGFFVPYLEGIQKDLDARG